MDRKYYVSNQERNHTKWKGLLIINENQIESKIYLAGFVYVKKDKVKNIEDYKIEFEVGENKTMTTSEAEEYLFLELDKLSDRQRAYIFQGWVEYEDITESEKEEIILLLEENGGNYIELDMEPYKVWGYHDGSNWREIILEHYFYDVEYVDYTEEFRDMKEIDIGRYSTGEYKLYRLKNDSLILVNNSYYQGSLWEVFFIDNVEITTIDEALEHVINKEKELDLCI